MNKFYERLLGPKAALIGAGLALSLLVFLVGTTMAATLYSQNEEKLASIHQLAIYEGEESARPQLESQLVFIRDKGANMPGYVVAENVALAQAKLEADIKGLTESNSGSIRSVQAGLVGKKGIIDVISLQYELTVPITHLKPLLYALETHTPYIYIDQIDIAAPAAWQAAQASGGEPILEVHWTIHAYRWRQK